MLAQVGTLSQCTVVGHSITGGSTGGSSSTSVVTVVEVVVDVVDDDEVVVVAHPESPSSSSASQRDERPSAATSDAHNSIPAITIVLIHFSAFLLEPAGADCVGFAWWSLACR